MSILKKIIFYCCPAPIITFLVVVKRRVSVIFANLRYRCCTINKVNVDYFNIPIIINNFNRLEYLLKLINSLEIRGYTNIHILDNHSTYPPLLEYYKLCPYNVYRLNKNVGYKAIWETGLYEIFKHNYYVYTDADMQIDEACPNNFMEHFVKILKRYSSVQKVGFGIRINDLPDEYLNKEKVLKWESRFWENEVAPGIYRASIDTTFALYRPYCKGVADIHHKVFRTGHPYIIRHLPWYNNMEDINEELYYLNSIQTSTHWSQISRDASKSDNR